MFGMLLRSRGATIILILVCLVIAGSIFAYLDYRSFEAETRGYLGVTFEDTRSVVLYRLGYPDEVLAPPEPGDSMPEWDHVYFTDRTKDPPNAMPSGKKVEDYNEWGFNPSNDHADVYIAFEPNARVSKIACTALKTGQQCPPLFGVRIEDTEASVVSKLGKPTNQKFDGVTKTLRYDDIGVDITLAKERVYRMASLTSKGDRNAILRRYLKARL